MSSEAKNLKRIHDAIKQHDANCDFPANAVLLNPFEADRLGWDEILGVPIVGDPKIPTGRIHVMCDAQNDGAQTEEIAENIEVVTPNRELMPV
jgi:hypothetical protein